MRPQISTRQSPSRGGQPPAANRPGLHAAWARQDVPKLNGQVDEALQQMQQRLMAERQRQAQAGAPLEPPEDLLRQIRALGGAEAEAEARRLYGRPWEAVDAASLEARVRDAATRALWDAVQAQVEASECAAPPASLGPLVSAVSCTLVTRLIFPHAPPDPTKPSLH